MTRVTRITLMLWPFGAGAVAVNLFFATLIGSWLGLPVIPPAWAVVGGAALGWSATRPFARHIDRLIDIADGADKAEG
ncbi:NnrT protein [Palleronia sediminis]|uniref:NnrT protein n=1 Tax=Palleronia sediminis TaxID=2547833 RepID=A0A4R6AAH1_9RHOB|nr:NnrT protein [Palleronia sediminis]TDL78256.1 NnrT protein [Palleronia sediminis]